MKTIQKFGYAFLLLGALSLSACQEKDPNDPSNNGGENGSINTGKELTVEESKEYLEKAANEFMDYFNPDDQKEAVELTQYLAENYDGYEIPMEFEKEYPLRSMKRVAQALRAGNFFAAATAAMPNVVNFDNYTGVYKVSGSRWVRVSDAASIKFQFKNANGQDGYLEITKDAKDYDELNKSPMPEDLVIYVPRKLTAKLVCGGKTYYSVSTTSALTMNTSYDVEVDATFANANAKVTMKATNTSIKLSGVGNISGKQVLVANATVSGRDMCNFDKLQYIEKDSDFDRFFQTIEGSMTAIDKVMVKATSKNLSSLADITGNYSYSDDYYDYPDFTTEAEAMTACQKDINTLTSNLTADVYLGGKRQASLGFIPFSEKYEWSNSVAGEVEVMPVIKFHDGTTYEIDEYFTESAFKSVVNNFDFIIRAYERLIK